MEESKVVQLLEVCGVYYLPDRLLNGHKSDDFPRAHRMNWISCENYNKTQAALSSGGTGTNDSLIKKFSIPIKLCRVASGKQTVNLKLLSFSVALIYVSRLHRSFHQSIRNALLDQSPRA